MGEVVQSWMWQGMVMSVGTSADRVGCREGSSPLVTVTYSCPEMYSRREICVFDFLITKFCRHSWFMPGNLELCLISWLHTQIHLSMLHAILLSGSFVWTANRNKHSLLTFDVCIWLSWCEAIFSDDRSNVFKGHNLKKLWLLFPFDFRVERTAFW